MLDRREKDAEELELESCLSELRSKAGANDDDIESMGNQSMTDLREMQEIQQLSGTSFYKPQIPTPTRKESTPKLKKIAPTPAPDWKNQLKNQRQMSKPKIGPVSVVPQQSSRLDAIYAQLKNLQSFKDEIMCDLEDFMEDEQTKTVTGGFDSAQFDEVVDIVVSETRAKAAEKVAYLENKEVISYDNTLEKMGLGEKEDKPFWTKFLRSDYLEEDDGPMLQKVLDVYEGGKVVDQIIVGDQNSRALELFINDEKMPETPKKSMDPEESDKMKKEWAKIRKLEQKLGVANKAQQEMQGKINDQKMRIEAALSKAQGLEEEKKQVTS